MGSSWMAKKILENRDIVVQCGNWDELISQPMFVIKKACNKLLGQMAKPLWRGLVCNIKAAPKCIFMIWMMVKKRLSTVDRLRKWRMKMDSQCKLCGAADESHQHLFIDCSYAKQVRCLVMRRFEYDNCCVELDEECIIIAKISKERAYSAKVYCVLWCEVMHEVWIQRCAKIYKGVFLAADQAMKQVVFHAASGSFVISYMFKDDFMWIVV